MTLSNGIILWVPEFFFNCYPCGKISVLPLLCNSKINWYFTVDLFFPLNQIKFKMKILHNVCISK